MKLVSDSTVTQHKPSVRMDTYIDFNESYIFLTATYIFHIMVKIPLFCQSPMPNSPHFLLLFPSQQLMQNNCP